jgi:hypothetical protein
MAPIVPPPPVGGVRARQLRRQAAAVAEQARYEMPSSDDDAMDESGYDDEDDDEWEEYDPAVYEGQQAGSSSAAPRNDEDDGWIQTTRSRDELPRDDTPRTPETTRPVIAPGAPRAQRASLVRPRNEAVQPGPNPRRRRVVSLDEDLADIYHDIMDAWRQRQGGILLEAPSIQRLVELFVDGDWAFFREAMTIIIDRSIPDDVASRASESYTRLMQLNLAARRANRVGQVDQQTFVYVHNFMRALALAMLRVTRDAMRDEVTDLFGSVNRLLL